MQFYVVLTAVAHSVSSPVATCPDGPDLDRDSMPDTCELQLAQEFAPILVVSQSACNWSSSTERLEGAYLFGVHPIASGVRITYLPAYLNDCGWRGPKCLLRWRGGCDPHAADSEFIVVDISRDSSGADWAPDQVFLSAHCFGDSDGDCSWHPAAAFQWLRSHPFVWVAEGKNANYPSARACDSGHWHFDTCDRNDRSVYYPVESLAQNIGSVAYPFPHHGDDRPCVTTSEIPLLPTLPGTECVWSSDAFRGWADQNDAGATSYRRYLFEVAELAGRP